MSREASLLDPLPEPVYFVFKDRAGWRDVFENADDPPPVESICRGFQSDPTPTWVLQTFVQLKRRGLHVCLVDRPVPGKICVNTIWQIGRRALLGRSYNVVVTADCCRPPVADHVIVQNPTCVLSDQEHLVYHWPQPGLVPRDPGRGDRIETVVYRGGRINLWAPLQTAHFTKRLAAMGVHFCYDNQESMDRHLVWQDYHNADLVLAMRNLTVYDERIKPATKLTNAWLAGVPAILGPESAYQDLRTDELDYVEARTVDDVINAIRRLKENPPLYRAMRERAQDRAPSFTPDAIAKLWRDTLAGPVTEGFRRWNRDWPLMRFVRAAVNHPGNCLRYRRTLKQYLADRFMGPRILTDPSIETEEAT